MRYLAYGSNLHPLRIGMRVESARFLGTAFVEGWSLKFHKRGKDGSGKCNIVAGGEGIHAAIYRLSESDRVILDRIEGLGYGYETGAIDVPGFGGCHVYLGDPAFLDDSLAPFRWYKSLVLLGARYHGFPASYVEAISAAHADEDPDPVRRAESELIVERIENAG